MLEDHCQYLLSEWILSYSYNAHENNKNNNGNNNNDDNNNDDYFNNNNDSNSNKNKNSVADRHYSNDDDEHRRDHGSDVRDLPNNTLKLEDFPYHLLDPSARTYGQFLLNFAHVIMPIVCKMKSTSERARLLSGTVIYSFSILFILFAVIYFILFYSFVPIYFY